MARDDVQMMPRALPASRRIARECIMNIMGGFEELLNFSVCGFASTGQEWVKNQQEVGSDWGFTKSNTAV